MSRGISALVIENEVYVSRVLEYNLTLDGFDVILASSGREGLKEAFRCQPDLILLDRKMPEIDGFDILCELKKDQATCSIPVLMLIDYQAVSDIEIAIEDGADGYITKPFDPMDLGKLIMEQLENIEIFRVA